MSRDILESIGARPDDFLDIEIKNDSIVLSKTFKHRTLEEKAAEFDGKWARIMNLNGTVRLEGSNGNMNLPFEQGDILAVEKMKIPVLVVNKNFFNQSEQAIVCPILSDAALDPLHIEIIVNIADAIQSIFDF